MRSGLVRARGDSGSNYAPATPFDSRMTPELSSSYVPMYGNVPIGGYIGPDQGKRVDPSDHRGRFTRGVVSWENAAEGSDKLSSVPGLGRLVALLVALRSGHRLSEGLCALCEALGAPFCGSGREDPPRMR